MGSFGIVLLIVLGVIVLLLIVAAVRAIVIKSEPKEAIKSGQDEALEKLMGERLGEMIKVPTLSKRADEDLLEFYKLHEVMRKLFPLVHEKCEIVEISANLIYRLKGIDSSRAIVLMAHQDVVPADEPNWKYPPFSGEISDGIIYGRGAVDCKCTLAAELSALEALIEEGFTPAVDVYICTSTNEENSGGGAEICVNYLKERSVSPELVMDEGGMVVSGVFPGLRGMCAVIGVTEKGYMDIKVTARSRGGHSSTPPHNNPLARLAAFIDHMEKKRPFKRELSSPVLTMFEGMAPHLSFPMRFIFANVWLFRPAIKWALPKASAFGEALLSTTFCFTMCEGSSASNVIPAEAYAVCNLRCIKHQDFDDTLRLFTEEAKKFGLECEVLNGRGSSDLVPLDGDAINYLKRTIRETMPDVAIAPYLMTGGTDCREYEEISRGCLRFAPFRMYNDQVSTEHSANENINLSSLAEGVRFYERFVRNYK